MSLLMRDREKRAVGCPIVLRCFDNLPPGSAPQSTAPFLNRLGFGSGLGFLALAFSQNVRNTAGVKSRIETPIPLVVSSLSSLLVDGTQDGVPTPSPSGIILLLTQQFGRANLLQLLHHAYFVAPCTFSAPV